MGNYKLKRKGEYYKANITPEEMIIAMWEMLVEKRSAGAEAMQAKREEIKKCIPKD